MSPVSEIVTPAALKHYAERLRSVAETFEIQADSLAERSPGQMSLPEGSLAEELVLALLRHQ